MRDDMASHGVETVAAFAAILKNMLHEAGLAKGTEIEPPLTKSGLKGLEQHIPSFASMPMDSKRQPQYAAVETAVRDIFNDLLATTTIDEPAFVQLWNLLDIVTILSDEERCDPALTWWLIEELLDSQTIIGCQRIFDFLESRRDRITAKHFKQKNLVILRSCNELLRRLSRADNTAFCGRVFIFMFQSFPLGDKSSVNLRGEYHVENVTTFDELPKKTGDDEMEVDDEAATPESIATKSVPSGPASTTGKAVSFDSRSAAPAEKAIDPDSLYPIFWSLQESFNQPKKLFDPEFFAGFKQGLEATMTMFKSVQSDQDVRGSLKTSADESRRGLKRKRGSADDDLANAFNPKYLTSRDLFELELSDLSFRRHVLVQALIVLDFLLSLSPKAKEKLARLTSQDKTTNKSVTYQEQQFSEEDTAWALEMKKSVSEYLQKSYDGRFFYRMVETVLSRDKNWVRWKINGCPSIEKPAILAKDYEQSKITARKSTTSKRLRPIPLGSLDLKFLGEANGPGGLEKMKDPERFRIPELSSFKQKILLDDMDIEMAMDEDSKAAPMTKKYSKTWRALRVASRSKLVLFEKIDNPEDIGIVFREDLKEDEQSKDNGDDSDDAVPEDRRPVVISGPGGVGKGTLIKMLTDKHVKVFGKKVSHTTRATREGEVNSQDYFFTEKDAFNTMRDGDEFLECNHFNGDDYGTSKKAVEEVIASGKISVLEMDYHGIQQAKEKSFSARYIFLTPSSNEELEKRLRERGADTEEKIQQRLQIAKEEMEQAKVEGFYDKVIVNDDLERTYEELEEYIFGKPLGQMEDSVAAGDVEAMDVKEDRSAEEDSPTVNGVNSTETGLKEAMEITATTVTEVPGDSQATLKTVAAK